jgi:hypothetical protein
MEDPVRMAMCDGGKELVEQSFDFGLEKWGGHYREESLEVMFDEIHYDEDSCE